MKADTRKSERKTDTTKRRRKGRKYEAVKTRDNAPYSTPLLPLKVRAASARRGHAGGGAAWTVVMLHGKEKRRVSERSSSMEKEGKKTESCDVQENAERGSASQNIPRRRSQRMRGAKGGMPTDLELTIAAILGRRRAAKGGSIEAMVYVDTGEKGMLVVKERGRRERKRIKNLPLSVSLRRLSMAFPRNRRALADEVDVLKLVVACDANEEAPDDRRSMERDLEVALGGRSQEARELGGRACTASGPGQKRWRALRRWRESDKWGVDGASRFPLSRRELPVVPNVTLVPNKSKISVSVHEGRDVSHKHGTRCAFRVADGDGA
ncbi:hypothetical protein B0H19DRAFT_1232603 [Mycena capillaripes]|nr:hypothetical protein B0H19DRAFT_1232603 [Mycena capillaripes]